MDAMEVDSSKLKPDDVETSVEPSVSDANLAQKKVFLNDLIMKNIIKHVPYTDRKNWELTCGYLYNLSTHTSCMTGYRLHLIAKKVKTEHGSCYHVEIKKKSIAMERYTLFNGPRLICLKKDIYAILDKFSMRFNRDIKRIRIDRLVNAKILAIINKHYKGTIEIYCKGFTADALHFLNSDQQTLSKRITKLGFENLHESEDFSPQGFDLFAPFVNLQKIYYAPRSHRDPTKSQQFFNQLEKLNRKVIRINVTNMFTVPENVYRVIKSCEGTRLTYGAFSHPRLTQNMISLTQNLTKLEMAFEGYSLLDVATMFSEINIHKIKSVIFWRVLYNDNVIDVLTPTENSKLEELVLHEWIRTDDSSKSLAEFFPKSLKKLKMHSTDLVHHEIKIIADKCPDLQFIQIVFGKKPKEHDTVRYDEIFHKALFKMKDLRMIVTTLVMRPPFLIDLFNRKTKVHFAMFNFCGADTPPLFDMLETVYGIKGKLIHDDRRRRRAKCDIFTMTVPYIPPQRLVKDYDFSKIFCTVPNCTCTF